MKKFLIIGLLTIPLAGCLSTRQHDVAVGVVTGLVIHDLLTPENGG